mmetsp:Transcript_86173/g.200379  ORF Transcript_86173/g.200379 Transcript_86173/m.200379 type:complete len:224 (+) Transcript_86173:56-727(+)
MVRVVCHACGYVWNARPDFDFKNCVKCAAPLKKEARRGSNAGANGAEMRKAKMRQRFNEMDISADGCLDFDEMSGLLRKGNPELSDIELWTLFHQIDKDSDGRIDFDEFYDYLYAPRQGNPASPGAAKRPAVASRRGSGSGTNLAIAQCTANAGADHLFKFGVCVYCGIGEGALLKASSLKRQNSQKALQRQGSTRSNEQALTRSVSEKVGGSRGQSRGRLRG